MFGFAATKLNEFEQGKREAFQPMFSFDFSLRDDQDQ